MKKPGLFLLAAFCILGCQNPSGGEDAPPDQPDERIGLFRFSGAYEPGETEKAMQKIPVLPFSLGNALSQINSETGEQGYLVQVAGDTILQPIALREGATVALRGLDRMRLVQAFSAGASGEIVEVNTEPLFTLDAGSVLMLRENITLLGSVANSVPLVATINGGRLELYDGAAIKDNAGGGVELNENGSFVMYGGEISGCSRTGGGGGAVYLITRRYIYRPGDNEPIVIVINGASFTMKGGVIKNNSSNGSGGGVLAGESVSYGGFIMEGGEIIQNTSNAGAGGVAGVFTMTGGHIHGNTTAGDVLYKNVSQLPEMPDAEGGFAGIIEGLNEVVRVTVTPPVPAAVVKGRSVSFAAQAQGMGTPPQDFAWSIDGPHHGDTHISPDGTLSISIRESAETLTVRAAAVAQPGISASATVSPLPEHNLQFKYGVTAADREGVAAVFDAIHSDLADGGDILAEVGDYVELYELAVTDDVTPGYSAGSIFGMRNTFDSSGVGSLRLVVAGVNTYGNINGNGAVPHLVFRFLSSLKSRRMTLPDAPPGDLHYPASEMREYLTRCFFAGLKNAGIKEEYFFAPQRSVSAAGGAAVIIEDTVWLPTERESGRTEGFVALAETAENQAALSLYQGGANLPGGWLASSHGGAFVYVDSRNRFLSTAKGTNAVGVVPAFCPAFCIK